MKMQEETIVLFPSAGIGHVLCMVELAKVVQTQHQKSNIIILLTTGLLDHPSIHAYVRQISTSHPSISFHHLPYTDPTTTAATAVSFMAKGLNFNRRNTPHVTTTLESLSKTTTIKALIIDLFCASTMGPASSMGIPVYFFFTSGAAALALFSYFPTLHRQTTLSFKDMVGVALRVPGNAPLEAVKLPDPLLARDDPAYWDMLDFCTLLAEARGIVVNTFAELEPVAVNAVKDGACFPDAKRAPPVYYIGPLVAEPQKSV